MIKKKYDNSTIMHLHSAHKPNGKQKYEENIEYHFYRLEKKVTGVKEEIYKFFIKSFIAQTSVLICMIFALIDFLLKK